MNNKAAAALNSEATSNQIIRRFLAAQKPCHLTPVDILILVHLMSRRAEDHDVYDSHLSLSKMANVDIRTIPRSLDRLTQAGYIHQVRRRGKTNLISIVAENIPAEEIVRVQITPDAGVLAAKYQMALTKLGRKKYPKRWLEQQKFSAQRILNSCGGKGALAGLMVRFALDSPAFKRKAMKSLYHLAQVWPRLAGAFNEEQARIAALKQADALLTQQEGVA